MLKDGNKPTVPTRARGPRGQRRRPGEAQEAASPELQPSSLETCRSLLRSILTHWEPVFPGPAPTQGPSDPAAPHSEAVGPVCTVAALVVSWVLRTATERPLSGAEAAGLLHWLRSHVVRQPEVVAQLLGDSVVRSGLFRLYSRLCTDGQAGPELNAVMLPLVAALSPSETPLPPAVETLRLASLDDKEEATRGDSGDAVGGGGCGAAQDGLGP